MTENKTRLWVGVGAYVLIGAGMAVSDGGDGIFAPATAHEKHAEGGEGGEGGEAGYTNADPDLVFAVNLLLTRGHLHIANELAAIKDWEHASAHAQHPAAETYDQIAPELKARGAAPFEGELNALVQQIAEETPGAPFDAAYGAVIAKIDAAYARIEASKRATPGFTMQAILALLKQAGAEYTIGVSQGKIVNLQEYQDANGFIGVADQLAATIDKSLPGMADIVAQLKQLKTAWSPTAGMGGMVTPEAGILAAISRIELKAGGVK